MRAVFFLSLTCGLMLPAFAATPPPLEFPPAAPVKPAPPIPPPLAPAASLPPPATPVASSTPTAPAPSPATAPATTLPPIVSTIVSLSPAQVAEFRDYVVNAWRESGVPGMGLALVQPGRVLLAEGFGTRSADNPAPVTADTRFALGPASQAMNSLLLARLAELQTLDLDAPARRCWDNFKLTDAYAGRIATLRQLLAMTAGVPGEADHVLDKAHAEPDVLFTALAQLPTIAQPGETFQYSESSAAAAGYLAVYTANQRHAPASGLPAGYAALAKTRLFDPVGMKTATFETPAPESTNDVAGHTRTASGRWQTMPLVPTPGALVPARGLRASVGDVAAWLQLELSGGVMPDGTRLVGEREVYERWETVKARDAQQYGVGWLQQYYQGRELLARAGEEGNQASLVVIVPQYRTALAVLLNGGGGKAAALLQDVMLNFADFLRETAKDGNPAPQGTTTANATAGNPAPTAP